MTTSPTTVDPHLDARTIVANRVFTLAGQNASSLAQMIDPTRGGLVLSGKKVLDLAGRVRPLLDGAPLLFEPKALIDHFSTAENPFGLVDESQLVAPSLSDVLDGQIRAGAALAVTPTGFMAAGNADPLKAAVEQANMLDRTDTLLLMPVDTRWCKEPAAAQLRAVLLRSRHPVALTLTGTSRNPWAEKGVLDTLRRLSADLPDLVLWRCDLTGFDAMSHGAAGAAIGSIASLRRAFKPQEQNRRSDPKDQSPHVLVEPLLRYARGLFMHIHWFANYPGLTCTCAVCQGRPLDRFVEANMSAEAAGHNQLALSNLIAQMPSDTVARQTWWDGLVRLAMHRHAELAAETKVKIDVPADLTGWSGRAATAIAGVGGTGRTPSH